jgi:hypothetical protein
LSFAIRHSSFVIRQFGVAPISSLRERTMNGSFLLT